MKKFDSFEEFMEEKKEAFFDEEPSFGHFNRFANQLEQLHSEPKRKKNVSWYYAVGCAAIVLLSMVIYPFLQQPNFTTLNPTETRGEKQPVEIDSGLSNPVMQASYTTTNANFDQMLEEITQLEMEYVQLKQYYNSRNHCDKVLGKMKENLETRLMILEKIHSQGDNEKINQIIHQQYLLNQSSDCFGYPTNQIESNQVVALAY